MSQNSLLTAKFSTHPANICHWGQLSETSLALGLVNAAQQATGPLLILTNQPAQSRRLARALDFFHGKHYHWPILRFRDPETLPYDDFSPHQDIISERLSTLVHLSHLKQGIVICPITSFMQRLCPKIFLDQHCFAMHKGESIDENSLRQRLTEAGYLCVSQVMAHGEFAIRGSIIDIFPMGSETAFRIDRFDEEVDEIRSLDTETQRSIEQFDQIEILPAKYFSLTDQSITHFRQQWREQFSGNPRHCSIYQDISSGIASPGIEYYLPIFYDALADLTDYLPQTTQIIRYPELTQGAEEFWQTVTTRYEQLQHNIQKPLLAPEQVFLKPDQVFAALKQFKQLQIHFEPIETKTDQQQNFATTSIPVVKIERKKQQPLAALSEFVNQTEGRVLVCAETLGRQEAICDLFTSANLHPQGVSSWDSFLTSNESLAITVTELEEGLALSEPKLTILTEHEIFGRQVMQRRRRSHAHDPEAIIRDLTELKIQDPIVHIEYGVGRYLGMQTLSIKGMTNEFLTIGYAGDDKIYVPVTDLHLIARYTGIDPAHAPLNKLGTDKWSKAKAKAAEKIRDVAAELLLIYAKREAKKGYQFSPIDAGYQAFSEAFPFEETPDQKTTIDAIIHDMTTGKAMDRLVCGDVGFGKTEVAMRAVYMAVKDSKQVAILVPTTLLAEQHFQSFTNRFANTAVRIGLLSRFKTTKEQNEVIAQLNKGSLDVIVGTHKILQSDVKYKNLGLVVIDEEHRFGVTQKDHLKTLRAEIDILTLTATPIPRTLNMAMSGMRDISIIATPPERRLAIKTFVQKRNKHIIKEAIQREVMRGGQVFFLHNRVQTIEATEHELHELLPEIKFTVAHGQMPERQLEQIMRDFYHRRYHVLICTTIIENGIDIPTANTIIIDRADHFGLAQLHQLRGRVGRSHHQAYAYLMTPDPKSMTKDAIKRLDAIASLEDLGAGFTLATHDLEIRGAGELLGEEQSGHIQSVGFNLYTELLNKAVKALQQDEHAQLDFDSLTDSVEIDLMIPALFPDTYIADVHTRLILYKRIANAETQDVLDELQRECIDRFGLLPDASKNLFRISQLRLDIASLGINKIEAGPKGGRIIFSSTTKVEPQIILKLIQAEPNVYKLTEAMHLRYQHDQQTTNERFEFLAKILSSLQTSH